MRCARPPLLRHLGMLTLTTGLLLAGFLTTGTSAPPPVSAAAGNHIEIAPSSEGPWANSVAGLWAMANMAPGDLTTGALYLRSVALPNLANAALQVSIIVPAGSPAALAEFVVVTSMTLGGVDLLQYWPASCRSPGGLPLSRLQNCPARQALPAPPPATGAQFSMRLLFVLGADDEAQAARLGPVTFVFTLSETSPPPSPPPQLPAQVPSPAGASPTVQSPAPLPSGTAVPTPTVPGLPKEAPKLVVRHDAPPGMAPSAFTLNVSGAGGLSGPGPELRTGGLEVGVPYTVSLVGPEVWQRRPVTIESAACVSDARGDLGVATARSLTLMLINPAESVTCTFASRLGEEAVVPGRLTPIPPSTGTGAGTPRGPGPSLVILAVAVGAMWLTYAGTRASARGAGR